MCDFYEWIKRAGWCIFVDTIGTNSKEKSRVDLQLSRKLKHEKALSLPYFLPYISSCVFLPGLSKVKNHHFRSSDISTSLSLLTAEVDFKCKWEHLGTVTLSKGEAMTEPEAASVWGRGRSPEGWLDLKFEHSLCVDSTEKSSRKPCSSEGLSTEPSNVQARARWQLHDTAQTWDLLLACCIFQVGEDLRWH